MANTEKSLENKFITELRKLGIKTVKGNSKFNKGFPDRMVFADKIYFVELKNDTYYGQTATQKVWQKIIENSSGTYLLLNGETEVKEFIEEVKKKWIIKK